MHQDELDGTLIEARSSQHDRTHRAAEPVRVHLLEADRELSSPRIHALLSAIEQLESRVLVVWVDLTRHEVALSVDKELVLEAALEANGLEHAGGREHHLKVAVGEGATVQRHVNDRLWQAARWQAVEQDHAGLNVDAEEVRLRPLRDGLVAYRHHVLRANLTLNPVPYECGRSERLKHHTNGLGQRRRVGVERAQKLWQAAREHLVRHDRQLLHEIVER